VLGDKVLFIYFVLLLLGVCGLISFLKLENEPIIFKWFPHSHSLFTVFLEVFLMNPLFFHLVFCHFVIFAGNYLLIYLGLLSKPNLWVEFNY
jgi:hypothetical protein